MEEEEFTDGDEIYTDDEKELLELLIYLTYELKKVVSFKREVRKLRDTHLAYCAQIGKDIDTFANLRYNDLQSQKKDGKERLESYHDVTCTKCNYLTSLKPLREERMSNGFTYSFYECPKCHAKFHDNLPNNAEDTLAFAKKNYEYLTKRGRGGQQNYIRLGMAKEQVSTLGMHYKALQVASENYKRENEANKVRAQEFAVLIARELEKVKQLKEFIMNGGEISEED